MPITPEAFNFHSCRVLSNINSNIRIGGGLYEFIGTGAVDMNPLDSADSAVIKGLECLMIRFEGLPPNTVSAEIKYVFHFEGTPSMNLNTVLTSAQEPIVMADPVKLERVRSKAILDDAIRLIPSYITTGMSGYAQGGPLGALTSMIAKLGL